MKIHLSNKININNKKVLVSLGPMRTLLDPVRYLQNQSSGRMGYYIANELKKMGANLTLLVGPVDKEMLEKIKKFKYYLFETQSDYKKLLRAHFIHTDIFISLAAVLDFEFKYQKKKIKKSKKEQIFYAYPVTDFVRCYAEKKKKHQSVIAFALENREKSLKKFLQKGYDKFNAKKNLDALLLNPISSVSGPMSHRNEIWIFKKNSVPFHIQNGDKKQVAQHVVRYLFSR